MESTIKLVMSKVWKVFDKKTLHCLQPCIEVPSISTRGCRPFEVRSKNILVHMLNMTLIMASSQSYLFIFVYLLYVHSSVALIQMDSRCLCGSYALFFA